MLTDSEEGRMLLNEAAFAIISEKAPQELPLYVGARDRYLSDPEQFLMPLEAKDEALGFGNPELVETFTEVVFPVLVPMLSLLVTEAVKVIGKDAGSGALVWVRSLFGKKPVAKSGFSSQQLEKIKKELDLIAESETRRLGLKKSEVQIVRDVLIARIALAST